MSQLQEYLDSIAKYSKDNNVLLIKGKYHSSSNPIFFDVQDDFSHFLIIIKKLSPLFIGIEHISWESAEVQEYFMNTRLNKKFETEIKEILDDRLNEELIPIQLTFTFESNGIVFRWSEDSEIFLNLNFHVQQFVEQKSQAEVLSRDNSLEHSLELQERLSKLLAKHPDYLKYSTRYNKVYPIFIDLAKEIDPQIPKGCLQDVYRNIKNDTDLKFEKNYKKQAMKTLHKEFNTLKNEKKNKNEIMTLMDITGSMYIQLDNFDSTDEDRD